MLLLVGLIAMVVGWVLLLRSAFAHGFWWGCGSALLPPVMWMHIGRHWGDARTGLLVQLAGLAVVIASAWVGPASDAAVLVIPDHELF